MKAPYITYIDEIASIRNYVKGAFEGLGGPWVKGKNLIVVKAAFETAPEPGDYTLVVHTRCGMGDAATYSAVQRQ